MSDAPIRPGVVTPRRLDALVDRLGAARLDGDPSVAVTGITHDSREVRPGDLYVARAGAATHGIDHVAQAIAAGAVGVLTDEESAPRALAAGVRAVVVVPSPRAVMGDAAAWVYGDPAGSMLVLGVTGTNGKTTTAYLLEAGLRAAGRRTGLLGTIETRIDGRALPSARTTPEATDLQSLFAVMAERGVDAVAMEVSSHALTLNRIDGTVVDVAAFTNLSQDHLDFHRDMADYFAAKARLFTPDLARRGVVCVDDEWGVRLAGTATIPVRTTGATDGADWRRYDEQTGPQGGSARLVGPAGEELTVRTGLTGRVNLSNAALAVLVLVTAGVDPQLAIDGVASLKAVPGRMERVEAGQPFLAVVDYAHTPDAVARLLADARRLVSGRVIAVLGCGGDRDRAKRPLMGAAVATGADVAVLTSDNPRSEDPALILAEMVVGVPPGVTPIVEPDRRAAIGLAVAQAGPDDAVVVAGKGHERGQEIAGQVLPFDDRLVLREALTDYVGAGVIPMSAAVLAQIVHGRLDRLDGSMRVAGPVVADSRASAPGALFVCVVGERTDGHDHVPAAVARGAVAALAAHPVDGPAIVVDDPVHALGLLAADVVRRSPVRVVGVTGSSGKTSTKDLMADILTAAGPTVAAAGSLNTEIGLPLTALRVEPSTAHLVLEYGARGVGHIAYLCGIARPDVAAVLNVGSAHLGGFGSRELVARSKGELVEALPAGGTAVLVVDDPLVARMAERTCARVLSVGTGAGAEVRVGGLQLDPLARPHFTLSTPAGSVELGLQLSGAHQALNAAVAAAAALSCGVGLDTIADVLGRAVPRSPHRMQVTTRSDGLVVIDDAYNANPESVGSALESLARLGADRSGRTWAVLGEMRELGPEAEALHVAAGRRAADLGIDELVVVGAAAAPLADGWEQSADRPPHLVDDAIAARDTVAAAATAGDTVLVKASNTIELWQVAESLLAVGQPAGAGSSP